MVCFRFVSNKEAQPAAISLFDTLYHGEQERILLTNPIKSILRLLRKNDIRLGIITNGPSEHQRVKIKNLHLNYWIKYESIFISGDYGFSKPDIQLFEKAEEAFGCKKKELWYVGDSYANDIIGAKQAGWNCIWFNRRKQEQPQTELKPNFIVGDEENLFHLFQLLLKK